jgi:hypothetical protein
MAQPEDAAAQALRLAAHALQHISLQSSSGSSSSDEEHDAAESAPLAAAAPAAAVDEPSPLASPKLAHKLLSSVAHVRLLALHAVCRMILISGLGYGFNLRDNASGGIGSSQRRCCHWSAHAQRRCSSWPAHA